MDNSEIHYLTYDPEAIYREMLMAYMEAGGDILYPGDEKEMLLRAVQAILTQSFAGIDNALRMATLRYATGEYLDIYGENRDCPRIEAQKAKAIAEFHFAASGNRDTIPAGTALTADGERMYFTDSIVVQTGYQQTVRVGITAAEEGSAGNGLLAGTQMQMLTAQNGITGIYAATDATGGQEREDDETYRERIRSFGLAENTTGPALQYEAAAKAVTSEILDAKAYNGGAGQVNIALLLASDTGADAILAAVEEALNGADARPLTDQVAVSRATAKNYTLNVQYTAGSNVSIDTAVAEAAAEYQKWQDGTIGRAFNPDRLLAEIYRVGANRVIWGTGSNFDGDDVEYTEIPQNAHCAGTITLELLT